MRRPGTRRFLRRASTVLAIGLLALASVQLALAQQPSGITEQAHKLHDLFLFVSALAIVVFVIVIGVLLYALVRYRKTSDELPPQTHGNTLLELLWVGIPVLLVVAMFSYSVVVLVDVEKDADAGALTIDVTGFQFQWQFTYHLNDLGVNTDPNAQGSFDIIGTGDQEPTFVMPVGEPVEFKLTSHDVIHSFYVRDFLYKLDVIPGRNNKFTVTATKTGEFNGQCAELCGIGHALMRFHVRVVTRAEFDQWVAQQSGQTQARQP